MATNEDRVVGFGAAFVRADVWFLASLFVQPAFQGQGVGGRLLELAWEGEYRGRLTITDAFQLVSTGLYARRGLIPATPILSMDGEPHCESPAGLEKVAPEFESLVALDQASYGFDRTSDHAYWSAHARPALWLRDGQPVAYSYAWPSGDIGPVAGRDGIDAAEALQAELASRTGSFARVIIPGSSPALVEVALAAGLRLCRPPGLLLLSRARAAASPRDLELRALVTGTRSGNSAPQAQTASCLCPLRTFDRGLESGHVLPTPWASQTVAVRHSRSRLKQTRERPGASTTWWMSWRRS